MADQTKDEQRSYSTEQARAANGAKQQAETPANDPNALVSVILPIYNAEPYLDQALDSVQGQTHRNLEIICLNDGSTDNSLAIMRKHAEADSRIKVIDKKNQGYGATCNRGLDESHGEWIAIVEPDDWIESGMYADMLAFAATFDEPVEIVKTPYWRIARPDTPTERKMPCHYKYNLEIPHQPFTIAEVVPLFNNHPSIWSAIYRKSFLDEHGIRFRPIPGAGWADNPFLAETLCQAKSIVYLDQAYYCYREDTPEKAEAFHKANPDIPFDRWSEMMDIIERLGITDERILCAHYNRGFRYAGGVLEQYPLEKPEVRAQLERMFSRMKPELVLEYPLISPGCRRLYTEICSLPQPKINHLQYVKNLIGLGLYSLRIVGPKETLGSVTSYFSHYKKRSGGR